MSVNTMNYGRDSHPLKRKVRFVLKRPVTFKTDFAAESLNGIIHSVENVFKGLQPEYSDEVLYQMVDMFCKQSPTNPRKLFLAIVRIMCKHVRASSFMLRKYYHLLRSLTPRTSSEGVVVFGNVGNLHQLTSFFERMLSSITTSGFVSASPEFALILDQYEDLARTPLSQLVSDAISRSEHKSHLSQEQSQEPSFDPSFDSSSMEMNMHVGSEPPKSSSARSQPPSGQRRAVAYLPSVSRLIWLQIITRYLSDILDRIGPSLAKFLNPLDISIVKLDSEAVLMCLNVLVENDNENDIFDSMGNADPTSMESYDAFIKACMTQDKNISPAVESAVLVALPSLVRAGIARNPEETSVYVSGRIPAVIVDSMNLAKQSMISPELVTSPILSFPRSAGSSDLNAPSMLKSALIDIVRTLVTSDIVADTPVVLAQTGQSKIRKLRHLSRASPMLIATLHSYSHHCTLERLSDELTTYGSALSSQAHMFPNISRPEESVTCLGTVFTITPRMFEPCVSSNASILSAFDSLSTTLSTNPPQSVMNEFGANANKMWRLINRARLRMRIRFLTDIFISFGMHKSHLLPTAVASAAAFYGMVATVELNPSSQLAKEVASKMCANVSNDHTIPRWLARLSTLNSLDKNLPTSSSSYSSSSSSQVNDAPNLAAGFVMELARKSAFANYITSASKRLRREVATCEVTPGEVNSIIKLSIAVKTSATTTTDESIELDFDPAAWSVDLKYLKDRCKKENQSCSQSEECESMNDGQGKNTSSIDYESNDGLPGAPMLHDTLRTALADAIEHELISEKLSILLEAGAPVLLATCNIAPLKAIFDVALRLNLLADLQAAFAAYIIICSKSIMTPFMAQTSSSNSSFMTKVLEVPADVPTTVKNTMNIPADVAAVESLIALEDGALVVLAGGFHAYTGMRQTLIRSAERSLDEFTNQSSEIIVSYLHRLLTGYNPLCDPASLLYSPVHFLPEFEKHPHLAKEMGDLDLALAKYAFPLFKDTSFSPAEEASTERKPLTESELQTHIEYFKGNKSSKVIIPRLHVTQFALIVSRVLSLFRRISGRDLFQTLSQTALGIRLLRLDAIHWLGNYANPSIVDEPQSNQPGCLVKYAVPLSQSRGTSSFQSPNASPVDAGDVWATEAASPLSWEAIILKAIGRECGHAFTSKHREMVEDIQRSRIAIRTQLLLSEPQEAKSKWEGDDMESSSFVSDAEPISETMGVSAPPTHPPTLGSPTQLYTPKLNSAALQRHAPSSLSDNPLALSLTVLTAGQWPKLDLSTPLAEPHPQVRGLLNAVAADYAAHYDGRRLAFVHTQGCAALQPRANLFKNISPETQIIVTGAQAVILSLFSSAKQQVSESEILQLGKFASLDDLLPILRCLTTGSDHLSNLINEDENGMYSLNADFSPSPEAVTNDGRFIRIPRSVDAPSVQTAAAAKSHFIDQEIVLEAAIVRILKRRKQIDHSDLVKALNEVLSFPVQPAVLKSRLERLIKHDFIERDSDNRSLYRYV